MRRSDGGSRIQNVQVGKHGNGTPIGSSRRWATDGEIRSCHREGFLQILRTRVNQPGFYLMNEPGAPLSFTAFLGWWP